MTDLTQARLKELLHYDPAAGVFTWRVTRCHKAKTGQRAGNTTYNGRSRRYRQIGICNRNYHAGRLAWLYVTGEWPSRCVDHANCDSLDDRWTNLRLATSSQNNANRRVCKNNTTGFKGVSYHKGKKRYRAAIGLGRKSVHLGHYDTPEEAHAAYLAAAKRLFGEFARAA